MVIQLYFKNNSCIVGLVITVPIKTPSEQRYHHQERRMASQNNRNSNVFDFSDNSNSRSSLQGSLSQDLFEDNSSSKDEEQLPTVGQGKRINFKPVQTAPNVAVQEKIVICIDTSHDKGLGYSFVNIQTGEPEPSPCAVRNAAIKLFITNKHMIASNTEFAIATVEEGRFEWLSNLTSDSQSLMNILSKLGCDEKEAKENAELDITPVFSNVLNIKTPPDQTKVRIMPPNFVIRVVLVYSNSYVEPKVNFTDTSYIKFITSPSCVLDVLYLHERQSDFNNVESIFKSLGKIVSPSSYIFESSRNVMKISHTMAKLLAHPYQRVSQPLWDF
uniref:BRISC and BRCA1-A complex member 1 n=1 Tax=Graphocephala atropunctata TaxID=36148 RepID=A0A1B6MSZ8_9HEMI